MSRKEIIKKRFLENCPLLCILGGVMLVSISIGPFSNGDVLWEYEAATNVINWGFPYFHNFGNLINQPPLGFYVEALFLKVFGSSINTGTCLVTLFGLGSTVVIYAVGKKVYSRYTGIFAATLFALSPWALILSRTFLIDEQCLFFSLLSLYVGIVAVQKSSIKLSFASGIIFAFAMLTKYFAVFILIPLAIYGMMTRKTTLKHSIIKMTVFILPAILLSLAWYQVILGKPITYLFHHSDFIDFNYNGVDVSYFFVSVFLWNYGLGPLFVCTAAFSGVLALTFRKQIPKICSFDLVCIGTIVPILVINTLLGVSFNLKAPYNNAIKYDFQALPFISLLAASLVSKIALILRRQTITSNKEKFVLPLVLTAGVLLSATIAYSIYLANQLSTANFLLFRVTVDQFVGYTLHNYLPTGQGTLPMYLQYVGFAIILFGLLWIVKPLSMLRKPQVDLNAKT
jgi:4-amino-4-deoxy-L-arabinose transferase-like glycosyltransferase